MESGTAGGAPLPAEAMAVPVPRNRASSGAASDAGCSHALEAILVWGVGRAARHWDGEVERVAGRDSGSGAVC